VFLVIVLLTRYVSLASIVAAATLPLFAFVFFLRRPDAIVVGGFMLISLIIIVKHHANIRRLLSGTESRFGAKSSQKAAA
jgi:glycerol-3-phosphate acyltransferase PlsY